MPGSRPSPQTSSEPFSGPDFESAWRHARERLEHELPGHLTYHSAAHTREDVVPAAERLAAHCGLEGEERGLLLTAAWYHDLGFVECRSGHEKVSVRIARESLPRFGFGPQQIDAVERMILATKLPQSPHTLGEQILADADLDALGREDYLEVNRNLRRELAAFGIEVPDRQWFEDQIAFLRNHRYFTEAAQRARNPGKARNIQAIRRLLDEI